MRALVYSVASLLCLAGLSAQVDARGGPSGTWLMQNRKAEVDIGPCAGGLCGTISRVIIFPKDGARTDVHNSNPALRRRPLTGLPVLLAFRRSGAGWRGRAYDPKSGGTYTATLTQLAPDRLALRACVLFVCKSQEWTRVR